MKITKKILTLLVLVASSVFIGCSIDEYNEVFEEKIEYTPAEKAEIYALAEKYGLKVKPMEQKNDQPLKTISELEEVFKRIVKKNNTKIPLIKAKDGTYKTKSLNFSKRTKSGGETSTFEWNDIGTDLRYRFFSDFIISFRNINTLQVNIKAENPIGIPFKPNFYSNIYPKVIPSNAIKRLVTGGYTFDFDYKIKTEDIDIDGRGYGEVTQMHKYISFSQTSFRLYGL